MKTIMKFHPSLKKIFKEVDSWLEYENNAQALERDTTKIAASLAESGLLHKGIGSGRLDGLGHFYVNQACVILGLGEWEKLAQPLRWGVAFRSLSFRFEATYSLEDVCEIVPSALRLSMKVADVGMLSQWQEVETGARFLIALAEKNLKRYEDKDRKDTWGKNTTPAFMIALFCQVFKLETFYYPSMPLLTEYQALLDHWQTADETLYRRIMQAAAEYHISRSKGNTNKTQYEFNAFIDTIFPAELLTIQALRRRDGLPEFETGHLLIDTPWSVIRDLPEVEPHPLIAIVEARIKHDYPAFR